MTIQTWSVRLDMARTIMLDESATAQDRADAGHQVITLLTKRISALDRMRTTYEGLTATLEEANRDALKVDRTVSTANEILADYTPEQLIAMMLAKGGGA